MAKLTRKSYKRKKIAFAAVILGGVALVSSGFAAWVLSSNVKQETNGSVNVGAVKNGNLKMNITSKIGGTTVDLDKGYFNFDTKVNDNTGRVRAEVGQTATNSESLSISYDITIKSPIDNFKDLTVSMTTKKGGAEDTTTLSSAKTNGYIVLPDCAENTVTLAAKGDVPHLNSDEATAFETKTDGKDKGTGEDDKDVVYAYLWTTTYTVNFKWGTLFDGKNPGEYYDTNYSGTKDYNKGTNPKGIDIEDSVVKTKLNEMHNLLDKLQYFITFTASVN